MLVLKIILFCMLALFLLTFIAFFLPTTVFFSYNKTIALRVYYCGIRVYSFSDTSKKKEKKKKKNIKDKPPKKEKSKKEPEKKKDKFDFIKKVYDKLGFIETVHYFTGLLKIILNKLSWVFKRIKFRKFKLNLSISGSDAAQTAILYGRVCSAIYPLISLIMTIADFKAKKIDVTADFNHNSSRFSISFAVRTLPIYFIIAAIGGLWEYKKYKGVKLHE